MLKVGFKPNSTQPTCKIRFAPHLYCKFLFDVGLPTQATLINKMNIFRTKKKL